MKVGILGSGVVGQALGTGFAQRGHEVTIGSRTPDSEKLRSWARKAGKNAKSASFAEAATAEILVFATLGTAVDDVIKAAGPKSFDGKIVIDTTNPLDFSKGMPPGLFVGVTDSLGERIQRQLPKAKVVKAFNTVPNSQMVAPKVPGGKAEMLICGNDPNAKAAVTEILRSFGWSGALDVGGIEGSRWLEAHVPLWVMACQASGDWNSVFQFVRGSP